jgi:signal transduction histidine kinase
MQPENREPNPEESKQSPELERARQLASDQRDANEQLVLEALRAHEEVDASRETEADLRAVAEFRERLIGIVGHDLRSPLSAILMGAGLLLRRGDLRADDARVVERILSSGHRMMRLIRDVLEFTKVRLGGGLSVEPKPADMRIICRFVAEEQSLASSRPVFWNAEGDVAGTWDSDRIVEALSNIVGNAIQHANAGTAVTLEARDEAKDVVVTVTNEGPPIPPSILPYIFEPFRRAEAPDQMPPATHSRHLGLGLYIASQIVRSHGGWIDAESSNGRTTFLIRLPRRPGLPRRDAARAADATT